MSSMKRNEERRGESERAEREAEEVRNIIFLALPLPNSPRFGVSASRNEYASAVSPKFSYFPQDEFVKAASISRCIQSTK